MLSLSFIRENQDVVVRAIADKNVELDLAELLALDAEVRGMKAEVDELRRQRNEISASFKDADPAERPALGQRAKQMGARAGEIETALAEKSTSLDGLMLKLPGIPWGGAPVGPDESFNTVVRQEGEPPTFDFEPRDHVALVELNDWADLSRVVQVAGSRTYALKGRLALLEQALMFWAQQRLSGQGFTLMTRPPLAYAVPLRARGQQALPAQREQRSGLAHELPQRRRLVIVGA